jgi:hypothetical protein
MLCKTNECSDQLVGMMRTEPETDTPLNQMRRVTNENPKILGRILFKSSTEVVIKHRLTIINR